MTTSSHGYDLADSGSLALMQAMGGFQARLADWLVGELEAEGFEGLTAGGLSFLGSLDCGVNHASALARRLGVSRQAIHKHVHEMAALGWLETRAHPDKGNQRVIRFTREGERMMSVARSRFAVLDTALNDALDGRLAALSGTLEGIPFPPDAGR